MDGFSLDIPDQMREAPELATGSVCLVARAEPWPWPQEFRPSLTAEVTPLAPDRATVVQLSALTIAGQIALGAHVAACDVWPVPGGEDGRRIMSLYPAMDTTVVTLQYVSIRGGRAVTVSMRHAADNHSYGSAVFRQAVGSIRCEFDDPLPEPDPATMPALDPFARERGESFEYLGGIRAAQPFTSTGPSLDDAQLEALRRGRLRRGVESTALQAGGLVDDRGRFTEMGQAAHRVLEAPTREVSIEVVSDDEPSASRLHAYQRRETSVIVASSPPGDSGAGTTLDVVASQTTPIVLARWVGLAPAWTFNLIDGEETTLRLAADVLNARVSASDAPAPAGANMALARLWAQPWQIVRLHTDAAPATAMEVISTPEAGSFSLHRDPAAGEVSLTPLPSAWYLIALLRLGGFDVTA
jgi:hypothetical protein